MAGMTLIEEWQALTPDAQAKRKDYAQRTLAHWRKSNPVDVAFRGVPISEFDRDQLITLTAYTFERFKVEEEKEEERFRTAVGFPCPAK